MVHPKYFIFILLSIIFQALGGIFGKYAALISVDLPLSALILNPFYFLFIFFLFLQAIVWQQALIHYPLSFAYPFTSLFNFIILLASAILFHEGITLANVIGLVIISVGIAVLSHKYGGDLCSSP
ncbi:MAG: hypothetical protein JXQ82_02780 [Methanomicrobiaceae archaeon]|nr:hypothetical protein [Methanomicrobiaceae archaeon]